jgi:hypothetical protein
MASRRSPSTLLAWAPHPRVHDLSEVVTRTERVSEMVLGEVFGNKIEGREKLHFLEGSM